MDVLTCFVGIIKVGNEKVAFWTKSMQVRANAATSGVFSAIQMADSARVLNTEVIALRNTFDSTAKPSQLDIGAKSYGSFTKAGPIRIA